MATDIPVYYTTGEHLEKRLERSAMLIPQNYTEATENFKHVKNHTNRQTKILCLKGELHFGKAELCPGV